MPNAFEGHLSRKFTTSSEAGTKMTLEWRVTGADDEEMAFAAAIATVPVFWRGIPRDQWSFEPQGGGLWHITIEYTPRVREKSDAGNKQEKPQGSKPDPENAPKSIGRQASFSTTGGSKHITFSNRMVAGKRVLDFDGSNWVVNVASNFQIIGWTRTGIAGTDVIAPNPEFQLSMKLDNLTQAYFYTLHWLTGKKNKDPYCGFDAGELLFLGADGHFVDADNITSGQPAVEGKQTGYWLINYRFKFSANRQNVEIIKDAKFPEIKGWDLVDIIYSDQEVQASDDPDDLVLMQFPEFIYIQEVYEDGDFGELEIDQGLFAQDQD